MVTQETMKKIAEKNKSNLQKYQRVGDKKGIIIDHVNQKAVSKAIQNGDILIGKKDKVDYTDSNFFVKGQNIVQKLKEQMRASGDYEDERRWVKAQMQTTGTDGRKWNQNCDVVKEELGDYPDFWYGDIILSGLADKLQDGEGSVPAHEVLVKEGVALMWAGNNDIYFNPKLKDQIVKGEEIKGFSVPKNKQDGLTSTGVEFFNNFARAYPVMETRTMLPSSVLGEGELICDASMWGEGATQTAEEGAFINVGLDWETGEVNEVYIINPDEDGNPIGFTPLIESAIEQESSMKNTDCSTVEDQPKP